MFGATHVAIPLVDLARTEKAATERKAAIAEEARILSEEDKAERAKSDELAKIPQDKGVYQIVGKELRIFNVAE